MKGFILLLVRLGSVSLIFFFSLSVLIKLTDKNTVGQFISAQNNVMLVSGIGSLGFYTILMYYSARSPYLLRWAMRQMLLCLPISTAVCLLCAPVIEYLHPTAGVIWIAAGGLAAAISTSLSGGLLGAGRYGRFTIIEVLSSAVFFVISTGMALLKNAPSEIILLAYVISLLVKIILYLHAQDEIAAKGILRFSGSGSAKCWRRPNLPLFHRFLGPSWMAGNVYAVTYRTMLAIFQLQSGASEADIALVWSILDRITTISQTLNLLIFRLATKSRSNFRRIRRLIDFYYIPMAGLTYFAICILIRIWTLYLEAPVTLEALYIALPLAIWGYRSYQQNLLQSQKMIWRIVYDLCFILAGWAAIAGASFTWPFGWWLRVLLLSLVVSASAVSLRTVKIEGN